MSAAAIAAAAESLVGVPFRLHGRDPQYGLDCVGVLAAALDRCGLPAPLPVHYALKMRRLPELAGAAAGCGFAPARGRPRPGDVLLIEPGPCQFHLVIAVAAERFVHAHAGLRRVVVGAGQADWRLSHHWRFAAPNREKPWRHSFSARSAP